jgi:thiamine pyrophosphate-dependent acetolactate synthase large subunit-like protein
VIADRLTVAVPEAPPTPAWGSDVIAELLAALELPYIALNPGASFRGLHDSLVNHTGNRLPQMLLCLHEEHAVAIAHGYAKVTGRPLAVALHSNVGLMHATMALFNAFCDRVPMLVLGALGPVDADRRRPWIDWIHTVADQGALVRHYTKWDDQPASVPAALEAVAHAHRAACTYPSAPTYVVLDFALQEQALDSPVAQPQVGRHAPPAPPEPPAAVADAAAEMLRGARRPLILAGRVGRGEREWDARVALAERLHARVLTDLKLGAAFPTDHPLHPAPPGMALSEAGRELIRGADVILSLDWVDLAGTLKAAFDGERVSAQVISCTNDFVLHNGWSKDHFGLPPADLAVAAEPGRLVGALLDRVPPGSAQPRGGRPATVASPPETPVRDCDVIRMRDLAQAVNDALDGRSACLAGLPLSWDGRDLHAAHPLDYLGYNGGGGVGVGPGLVVGAALGLQGTGRLPAIVVGDGDYLMGATALWTAAHYRLGMLVVVANNRSFFNDEAHQDRVARARDRPVENRWLGQHIRDPDPDLAALARSLGLRGHGPVERPADMARVLAAAVQEAADGAAVVVDVRILSEP